MDFGEHITGLKKRVESLEEDNAMSQRSIDRNEREIMQLKAIIEKLERD